MKKPFLALLLLLLTLTAPAYAAKKPKATPPPDHSAELAQIALALAENPQSCDLTAYPLTPAELRALFDANPDTAFRYNVTMYGCSFPADSAEIDFGEAIIKDTGELKEGLGLLPNLEQANMYESLLKREQQDELAELFPHLRWGWTLKLGSHKVRTDATAFSSLHAPDSKHYSSGYYSALKYCYQLEALDLGHNKLTDLSFLENMTELKILILADNQIRDITPLKNLRKLEYVELFMNRIKDISPLENMENLLDLNICFNLLDDVSPVLTLPKLERLWVSHNKLSPEYQNELSAQLPNVEIVFSSWGSTSAGWREHDRYFVIKDVFDNWNYRPFTKEDDQ